MTVKEVRGHMCEGLKKYQEFSTYGCIPDLSEEGYTRGCDDTNYIPILFCPFCGEELSKPKRYKFKCRGCNNEWEGYEYEEECKNEDCYGLCAEGVEI